MVENGEGGQGSGVNSIYPPLYSFEVLLSLQILALWPVWRWYVMRLQDGSDEPGLMALSVALLLLYWHRQEFKTKPRVGQLLIAGLFTVLQTMPVPPLLRALLGVTALGFTIAAFLPRPRDATPLWALLALSLPLVASLQFYAGYPLRLIAAGGAGLLLRSFGLPVLTEGAALRFHELLLFIDAPCSGVQMLWTGLVTVSVVSVIANATPLRLLLNASLAVLLVLFGNILRSAVLLLKESNLVSLPSHDIIGLVIFAIVLLPIVMLGLQQPQPPSPVKKMEQGWGRGWGYYTVILLFITATVAGSLGNTRTNIIPATSDNFEWPTHFQARGLTSLPMSAAESRWLRDFPGRVANFTDGIRSILMRYVERPTRMLHPAADCYRGAGYTVSQPEIVATSSNNWSCFVANKADSSYSICEYIRDEHGRTWTDVSAWYWSAILGNSQGPWWTTTVAKMQLPIH